MIPLVSVITPCYNGANYIAACIESVLAQTLVNWEMLIVDDCSTDNSAEIILSYVKKDTRIRFFKRISHPDLLLYPEILLLIMLKGIISHFWIAMIYGCHEN